MDQNSNEEKVCDICGHSGVVDAILRCTQCKVNHEHMYCARVLLEEFVEGWICGECESSSKSMPESEIVNPPVNQTKAIHNESRVGAGSWEKRVDTGKTKYISVNEAIKLSSGEKATSSVGFRLCPKPKPPKIGKNIFERSSLNRKTVPMSFASHQDPASGSTQQNKLQRVGNAKLAVSSLQPSDAPKNRDTQKELPRYIQWAQTKARRVAKKQSFIPKRTPITTSGNNTPATNEQKISDDANVLPDSEKCSFAPALNVLWKGSFNIQEDKLNQIRAHPPSRVLKKVIKFSKKMPDVLQFELVSAKSCWLDLFSERLPSENHIALYFFPSVEGRWSEYLSLVESISTRELALRKQIDDTVLFVFPSKCLPVNVQCVDEKHFLWGVFHHPAQKRAMQGDVSEEVDMEIDMTGGIDVGRLDTRVKREPDEGPSAFDDLVPPGFEEVYRSRLQGSSKNIRGL